MHKSLTTTSNHFSQSNFKYFLFNFLPVMSLAIVSVYDYSIGAIYGAILALIFTVKHPFYVLPILMFAAAFRLLGLVGGIFYGWVIVIGFLVGTIIKIFSDFRIDIYKRWFTSAFILLIPLLILSLISQSLLQQRSIMLIALLLSLGLLINKYLNRAKSVGPTVMIDTLLYSMASASIAIALAAFMLFSAGDISQSRVSEMSFSIGEQESSPSNLTRLLGIAVLFSLLKVFQTKLNFKNSIVYLASIVFGLAGMIYGGSRMPIFAILTALLIFALTSSSKLRSRFFKIIFSGAFLLFLGSIFGLFGDSIPFLSDSDTAFRIERAPEVEGNARLYLWSNYMESIDVSSLIIGKGIYYLSNPHSVYIGFFIAFGFVGIGVCLYLFYHLFKLFFRFRSSVGKALLVYTMMAFSSNGHVDSIHFWIVFFLVYVYAELLNLKSVYTK